mmetsp:Transcript_25481/g.38477  ORF Transcript_25481/g.38477 Transcript_25481/m.38477 type:complete len:494 (-) Transcript_25481:153-1634(-)
MRMQKNGNTLFAAISCLFIVRTVSEIESKTCSNPDSCTTECVDKNVKCLLWAERGECSKNQNYMHENCMQSCEICSNYLITVSEPDEECNDHHQLCKDWAEAGECVANDGYMLKGCKKACGVCFDVSKARNEGMPEYEILRQYRFASADWGVYQPAEGNETEKAEVTKVLISMREYALSTAALLPIDERLLCRNNHELCAFWASVGSCEDNLPFMMRECPLVCRYCHTRMLYDKCHKLPKSQSWMDDTDEEEFSYLWMDKTYASIKSVAKNAELVSSEKKEDITDPVDPWVLKVENFITSNEADAMAQLAKTELEWVPSDSWQQNRRGSNDGSLRRESTSAFCDNNTCKDDNVYQQIRTRILGLIKDAESHQLEEPMEFVHYQEMQSFATHHDFNVHDNWNPAGSRVLSFFLCLSDVEEGGSIGFPDLDWLTVPPRKGQLLIWPNVILEKDLKTRRHPDMSSEGLPVTSGEKYGIQTWMRLRSYEDAKNQGCV